MEVYIARAIQGLLRNLRAALGLALCADVGIASFAFGPVPLALLWTLVLVCYCAVQLPFSGPVGGFSPWGASFMLGSYFALLAALQLSAILIGRGAKGGRLQVMVLATLPTTYGLVLVLQYMAYTGALPPKAFPGAYTLYVLPLIAAIRGTTLLGGRSMLHGLVPAIGLVLWIGFSLKFLGPAPIFEPATVGDDETAQDWRPVDVEEVYYAQAGLVAAQLDALRPGTEGEVELFAILAAYYPDQGVFLREIESAGDILADRFAADGHLVRLANSRSDPSRYPLANRRNLETALNRISTLMNQGEDVLLVYLTSHGSKELISAGYWEVGTSDLGATQLAAALEASGIRNAVVIISACKSGSFIPALEAPDRLIITAAAADRNSFGCSDKNEWTYFGEAYFARALGQTGDLGAAFGIAAQQVAEWESAGGQKPSEPQMALGDEIGRVLDRLASEAATH